METYMTERQILLTRSKTYKFRIKLLRWVSSWLDVLERLGGTILVKREED